MQKSEDCHEEQQGTVDYWKCTPAVPGKFRRGGQKTSWMKTIQWWTGLSLESSLRATEDLAN